jgi:hypothetical protein
MSDTHKPTVEDLNAELAQSKLEMEEKMRALEERLQVAQECEAAEEEKVRKAKEEQLKAKAEQNTEEERLKAKAEWEAEEARKVEEMCKSEEARKAEDMRRIEELHNAEEAWKAVATCKSVEAIAETERLHKVAEAEKQLDRELMEHKEWMEAEEKERLKAGNGMMLATPGDVNALKEAWQINAKNTRIWVEGYKPRAGSSRATLTPTPKPKPKPSVNLARQVWEDERLRKTENSGKSGDATVSSSSVSILFSFSDLCLFRMSCAITAQTTGTSVSSVLGWCVKPATFKRFSAHSWMGSASARMRKSIPRMGNRH